MCFAYEQILKSKKLFGEVINVGSNFEISINEIAKKDLFAKLQDRSSINKLVNTLSQRYNKRHGGYSRVIRAGFRYGDDAAMAIIELVDRDTEAKKVDLKKKENVSTKKNTESKIKDKDLDKKTKSKK